MKTRTKLLLGALAAGTAGVSYKMQKYKKAESVSGEGKTVLITGASSGIGEAFARIFAAHQFDLVISARSRGKLNELANYLRDTYDVKVTVIPADLSKEEGAKRLAEEVSNRKIHIDQLVNNAGAGKAGDVVDADPDTMLDLMHLNMSSVTLLCHYFGSEMKKAGSGKILNVSSLGAFIPDPHFNVYGPTKAYELFLSEAMSGELKGSGITVSVLCPGPTKTNWAKNAGKADSRSALNPIDVAKIGFIGMQNGDLVIVPTVVFKSERRLMGLLPAKLQVALIDWWQSRLISENNE